MSELHEELLLRQLLAAVDAARAEIRAGQVEGAERGRVVDARLAEVVASGAAICAQIKAMSETQGEAERAHKALAERVAVLEGDRRLLQALAGLLAALAGWLGYDRLIGWLRGHP